MPTAPSACANRSSPTSSSAGCSPCTCTSTPPPPISTSYGEPQSIDDLDNHTHHHLRRAGAQLPARRQLAGDRRPRFRQSPPVASCRSTARPRSSAPACSASASRMLPDYIVGPRSGLIQLAGRRRHPSFDTYFCYPERDEELRQTEGLQGFHRREGVTGPRAPSHRKTISTFLLDKLLF